MAEKSLVNDDTETLGAAAAELLAADVDELPLELALELEFELPQAATPTLAVAASAAMTALLFSKCTLTSSSYSSNNAAGALLTAQRLSQLLTLGPNPRAAYVN
jgi:hypothetical protein